MIRTPLHLQTPLFDDVETSQRYGRRIFLKMDCFQPVGSFKIRGIGLLCQRRIEAGARSLISSSGGNAGFAVAYAGHQLGVGVTVVVPASTPLGTQRTLARWNARVIVHGTVWDEADALARELASSGEGAYISPFDDPLIWEGHASLVDEIAAVTKPDAIIVSVGGGGLMCGVLEGLHRRAWTDVQLIAVETEGADSLNQSIRAGAQVTLASITSIAKSLGARRVADEAFAWTQRHAVQSVVVSDRAAVQACLTFADAQRVLVEPACGAALAVAYQNHASLREIKSAVVIVCGGISTSMSQLMQWSKELPP